VLVVSGKCTMVHKKDTHIQNKNNELQVDLMEKCVGGSSLLFLDLSL
jgi:hypothetical protein